MNNLGTKTLQTERLILRKFKKDDALNMYNNWATDSNTNKYLSWDLHKNIKETKKVIKSWIKTYKNNDYYNWVVELKENKEIIGNITVVKIFSKANSCEIGYCYGSKYWGKGYATEALSKVISYMLNECDYNLVEACHIKENPASGHVMVKSGMTLDAVLRERSLNKNTGNITDEYVYSITKNELIKKTQ